jgi:ankyrin repeat protein
VLVLAGVNMLVLASVAAAADKEAADDLSERFFADERPAMEKAADNPGKMKEYVLSRKDVNAHDENGMTLLHYAARKGYCDVVVLLIAKGADINVRSKENKTPLHKAMRYHVYDVARLLINKGADMTLKDEDGKTPPFSVVYDDGEEQAIKIVNILHRERLRHKEIGGREFPERSNSEEA